MPRRGGFPTTHKQKYRADLDDTFDSAWEANIARYYTYLLAHDIIAGWSRKKSLLLLPVGEQTETTGNRHIELDFRVSVHWPPHPAFTLFGDLSVLPEKLTHGHHGVLPTIVEVKGRFAGGAGWLHDLSESRIRDALSSDKDSAIKLVRLKKKYPDRLVYVLGDAEYARLRSTFKAQCPAWED